MRATDWALKECKFAQGTPNNPAQGVLVAPQDDLRAKVAESFTLLFESLTPRVDIRDFSIDKGSRGSFEEEGYSAFVEELDATISFKGQNFIDMNEEAAWHGMPSAEVAHKAYSSVLPVQVTVYAKEHLYDFKLKLKGQTTITKLGPLGPDGKCQFSYSPAPIPVMDYESI